MQSARYILFGQICFYAGMLICVLLRPHGLTANGGISYYGVYRSTIFPYIVALLGPAYFTIKTAELHKGSPLVRYSLTAIGLLTIGVLVTPDSLSSLADALHRACGASLFVLQLLLSGWLCARLRYAWWAVALALLELASGVASFIWLSPQHGYLLEAQLIFQAAFGLLLYRALPRLALD